MDKQRDIYTGKPLNSYLEDIHYLKIFRYHFVLLSFLTSIRVFKLHVFGENLFSISL